MDQSISYPLIRHLIQDERSDYIKLSNACLWISWGREAVCPARWSCWKRGFAVNGLGALDLDSLEGKVVTFDSFQNQGGNVCQGLTP